MIAKHIAFSSEMVRAILAGIKTQTRRVIRGPAWYEDFHQYAKIVRTSDGFVIQTEYDGDAKLYNRFHVGDEFYVRESFYYTSHNGEDYIEYLADGTMRCLSEWPVDHPIHEHRAKYPYGHTFTPRIAPRCTARLSLLIEDVRVQHIQEISEADAEAEGSAEHAMYAPMNPEYHPIVWFRDLWDAYNVKLGYGWDFNPLVWAVTFKRKEPS